MDWAMAGRLVRAARAYGGYAGREKLAARLQVSKETLQRIESGQRELKRPELLAIAEACDVPVWFLEGGWDGWVEKVEEAAGRANSSRGDLVAVIQEAVALVQGPARPSRQRRTGS